MPVALLIIPAAIVIAAVGVLKHARGSHFAPRHAPGGILIADARAYDTLTRVLLGSLFRSVASDVAAAAPPAARILEVGCGPGHLSIRLARDYGLDVTGLDLDPAMIERACTNAARFSKPGQPQPRFVGGDVAALSFDDASFDLVVSTFSMHHWSDPGAGLREIARVLQPGGRALIWDLDRGARLFHSHVPDPSEPLRASPLQVIRAEPWRWPWRFALLRRFELAGG